MHRIIITGPTASEKSFLAYRICGENPTLVINASTSTIPEMKKLIDEFYQGSIIFDEVSSCTEDKIKFIREFIRVGRWNTLPYKLDAIIVCCRKIPVLLQDMPLIKYVTIREKY